MNSLHQLLLPLALTSLTTFAVPVVFENGGYDQLYDRLGSLTTELRVAPEGLLPSNTAVRTSPAGTINNQIGFNVTPDLIDISVSTFLSRNEGAGEVHADTRILFTVLEPVQYSLAGTDTLDQRGLFGSSRRRLALVDIFGVAVAGDEMLYRDAGTYEYAPTIGELSGILQPGTYAFRWDTILECDPESGLAANSGSTTALLSLRAAPVPDSGSTAFMLAFALIGVSRLQLLRPR